jgi:AcrR family transcriptional regulator
MTPATATRSTAEIRREDVLEAALAEFGVGGMGVSTQSIARRAGISQPYLFRLYPTKKDLFIAAVDRCFALVADVFVRAGEGLAGMDACETLGTAYGDLLADDPSFLRMQMQAYATSTDDPDVRAATLRGYTRLWDVVVAITGMDDDEARSFFAEGMLWNVTAALGLGPGSTEPLAGRLIKPDKDGHPGRPGSAPNC